MKKVTKAIIPAAGLGTRMLPISKAIPKEVLPIVDKPVIQYLVEEAVDSGITDILIITNRGKGEIEDYFDHSIEYELNLEKKGKLDELEALRRIADLANITFLRQKETRGLGHAVGRARSFVGDEPFAILYGDDVIDSPTPTTKNLIDVYEKTGLPVVGVQKVSDEAIMKYSSLKVEKRGEREYFVTDMIEKPKKEEILSNFSILGRVLLTPDVFDIIDCTAPGAGGEIQLTDAMKVLARDKGIMAYEFAGKRHDMGSKLGFLMANVELGVKNPEFGEEFKKLLKAFAEKL